MKNNKAFTLTEVVVVLLIITVLTAIAIPSLAGFIRKAKVQQYVLEAEGVFQSVQAYMISEYEGEDFNISELLERLNTYSLTSTRNHLYPYLTVTCSKKSYVTGITIDYGEYLLYEMTYEVDNYKIYVTRTGTRVEDVSK